ncbi:hypothetical protein U9M48_030428 [Paspalum notatum var. saurae]|uniref:Rx N-terminal domain-containing protein n=1 Tax=Paspalum notatum var. saurae TaxID=547442 RepID=A0AAQ3X2L0_PASNO
MAAQTQGAVDALLSLLSTAVKDETRLIGGVPGDMQFIKEEMDSMNGFLMHLTKMEGVHSHDDQIRAWMKQVREIAYMSEDCVERYVHEILPHYAGSPGFLWINVITLFLCHPKTYCKLHKVGKQMAELKLRVREVGERRKRYDVSVPAPPPGHQQPLLLEAAAGQQEEERKAFRDAVEQALEEYGGGTTLLARAISLLLMLPAAIAGGGLAAPSLRTAMANLRLRPSEAATVIGILERCRPAPAAGDEAAKKAFCCCTRMFLCALFVYPHHRTNDRLKQDLKKLMDEQQDEGGAEAGAANRKRVMTFCYSLLSTQQKSCLQYLIAFRYETEISRTSMVRRWAAEGLVAVLGSKLAEPSSAWSRTPEEEGERCFSELLFRGFIKDQRYSDAGSVKSCVMEPPIRDFLVDITGSENFLAELPAHLQRQIQIRDLVQKRRQLWLQEQQQPQSPVMACRLIVWGWRRSIVRRCSRHSCCCCCCCVGGGASSRRRRRRTLLAEHAADDDDSTNKKDPMDKLLAFLDSLPEMYRLNVLDLGGCTGLKDRYYLREFIAGGKLGWLKYLSLRNTDVAHLPAQRINKLPMLETLDIRDTNIPHSDTRAIRLPRLKHLVAGRKAPGGVVAVPVIPYKTGSMRSMETLSHVHVSSKDGAELVEGVARLKRLRKLGVVVHGNQDTAASLARVLDALAACLRSLSVQTTQGGTGALDISSMLAPDSSLVLENLDITGKTSGLPPWVSTAQKLANVTLRDTQISGVEALRRLATVPNLRCLKLGREAFTEQALVFKDVPFRTLKFLVVDGSHAITSIDFAARDVAPALEKIVWTIGGISQMMRTNKRNADGDLQLITGIGRLPSLKLIELRGDFKLTTLLDWADAIPAPKLVRYHCRFTSSSDANKLIKDLPKAATDTTLSLPVRVINTPQ